MKAAKVGVIALLALAVPAACASHKTTIQTRNGTATVTTSQDNKRVTLQTNEGTTSIGQTVDIATLGAPVYPGAQAGDPPSITTVNDSGSTVTANFTTTDAFDKVYGYYKRRLPPAAEKMKVTSGNGSVASFQVGDASAPEMITVQLSSDKPNMTNILITRVTRTKH
jgi:hypothetical protein